MQVKSHGSKETKELGFQLAGELIKTETESALVVGLQGELGAGKTTFVKGFADRLGVEKVTSPTFVIMKKYEIEAENFSLFYHVDGYRLEEKSDLSEIGFEDILKNEDAIVLVEWPEKISSFPKKSTLIKFKVVSEKERELSVKLN